MHESQAGMSPPASPTRAMAVMAAGRALPVAKHTTTPFCNAAFSASTEDGSTWLSLFSKVPSMSKANSLIPLPGSLLRFPAAGADSDVLVDACELIWLPAWRSGSWMPDDSIRPVPCESITSHTRDTHPITHIYPLLLLLGMSSGYKRSYELSTESLRSDGRSC